MSDFFFNYGRSHEATNTKPKQQAQTNKKK